MITIEERKRLYKDTLKSPIGEHLLKDLSEFCGMNRDGFSDNNEKMSYLAGRRSVFLYIKENLKEKEVEENHYAEE